MLQIKLLSENARIPSRGSKESAGYDLYAAEKSCILPFDKKLIFTDIAVVLPEGVYGRVAPRSGLALKHIGIGAGVIDRDYRGNVGVVVFNHSNSNFIVNKGDRIAQLILEKCLYVDIQVINELEETKRGENGFGSS